MTKEELTAWRISKSMNKTQFARFIGRSVRAVHYWESGKYSIPEWVKKVKDR